MAEEFLSIDEAFFIGSGIDNTFETPDLETFCQTFDRDYSYKFDENEILEFTPESIFDQIVEGNCSFSSSSDDDGIKWDLPDHKQGSSIKSENEDNDVININLHQKDYSFVSMYDDNFSPTNSVSPVNGNGNAHQTELKEESETQNRIIIGQNTSPAPKLISLGVGSILCNSVNNVKIMGNASPKRKTVPIISKHVTSDKSKSRDRSANYEISLYKKQQRMIRNRESALLSRKRKREYVSSLEQEIKDLKKENEFLKQENSNLKSKMAMQQQEIPNSKFDVWKKCKKVSALLAVALMISFNIPNFLNDGGFIEDNNIIGINEESSQVFHKRSLLWAASANDGLSISNSDNTWNTSPLNNSTLFTQLKCPMYINQTESIRLDSELRRWIKMDESKNSNEKNATKKMKEYRLNDIDDNNIQKPLVITEKRKRMFFHHMENTKFGQMYKLNQGDLFESTNDALYQAMHRKLDTFYVVSFSQDHLLLPALNNNRTLIPKMSLLLPSLPHVNNTDSMVSMMQIDCAVTDIRLLQMKEKDIPLHLRSHLNKHQSSTNNDTFINTTR